jgi:Calx-beta domain-containing protein
VIGALLGKAATVVKGFFAWCGAALWLAVVSAALSPMRAVACLSDSDCNDGLFCTTDHCILFVCFHFDRDCNDFNDCTRDSCSETQNACVHENLDFTHSCEDFNIFTTAERCDCAGGCVGLLGNAVEPVTRCCVSVDCPSDQLCVDTVCVLNPTPPPTPTRTGTPTRTPTRTNTPTPDNRPALSIGDFAANEGNSGHSNFVFTLTLSKTINQQVTLHFATVDGSAIAGSDYSAKSGNFTIPKNTLSVPLPGIAVNGDTVPEADETFFVQLTNVSTNVRVADGTGRGTIVNDDGLPPANPGIGALSPHDGVVSAGQDTPVTLTWTTPHVWRDLNTVDFRLRGQRGIIQWLRFDQAANTLGLIHPADVSLGPAFPPGSPEELTGESVTLVLAESSVQASDPEAPSVTITFTLRFASAAIGNTYLVDAAATDDAGDVQDFDTIGTISVAPASCPGDCSHDGSVTLDELLLGVDIALGATGIDSCPEFDMNGNGTVEIGEIVAAVGAALEGCGGGQP